MTLLERISRRQFLGGAAAVAAGAVFDACAPRTNASTASTTPGLEPTPTDALVVVFRGGTIST
jgi:secreted PhoX family phosphatase